MYVELNLIMSKKTIIIQTKIFNTSGPSWTEYLRSSYRGKFPGLPFYNQKVSKWRHNVLFFVNKYEMYPTYTLSLLIDKKFEYISENPRLLKIAHFWTERFCKEIAEVSYPPFPFYHD